MNSTPTGAGKRPGRAPFRRACLLALLLVHGGALGQSDFEDDFDDPYKPWQELAVQLPATPRAQDLLPFEVSGNTTHEFAVDANSVSIGSDGIIRYTLVTVSGAGARNVSYEGLRCETWEIKRYAFGQPDGSWSRSRRDQWQRIVRNAANRQHAVLALDFMCLGKTVAGPVERIVSRLREGRSINPSAHF